MVYPAIFGVRACRSFVVYSTSCVHAGASRHCSNRLYQNLWVLKATAPRAQLFELNILLLVPPGYSKQSAKQALETACKRIKPVRYMLRYGYSTVLEYRPLKEGTPKCLSSILLTNKPSEGLMSRSNELWAGFVCLLDFVL